MPHILRGELFCLTIFYRLAKRTGWGVDAAADVAYVVDGPALALTDHQHFILPGLAALRQFDSQRDVARIGVRDGRGAGDVCAVRQRGAAGERIGFQQRVVLWIARGIVKQFRQVVTQVRAQSGEIAAAMRNAVIIELLSHGIRAAVNARTAACPDILKSRCHRGGAGAEQQRARH